MSLLDDFARSCVLMEKTRSPDGAGGYITKWTDRAEKEGVKSLYSALVNRAVPIEYGDYFKDRSSGTTYRVTSDPSEKEAPKSATFALKAFTAERAVLPQ